MANSNKQSNNKENVLKKVLLAILPGLIVAGLVFSANIYYDLDTNKIIVQEVQKITESLEVAKDFVVDTSTLVVDSVNHHVGIGTTAPGEKLEVAGNVKITQNAYLATAGGNVGIGTTTPAALLHVVGSHDTSTLTVQQNGSGDIVLLKDSAGENRVSVDTSGNIFTKGTLFQPIYGSDDGLVGYWSFSEKIGAEELADPSFEAADPFTNWKKFGEGAGYSISTTTEEAKDGNQSVKLEQSTTTPADFGIQQDVHNLPSTTYQLNGWVKLPQLATTTNGVVLQASTTDGVNVSQTLTTVSTNWQFISLRFTTGANDSTTTVKFYLSGQNGPSTAYLDLVSLKKANTAYTYDYSPYGNDGTIYGSSFADGKYGQALSFDGVDDYVDCGSDASLNIGVDSGITVEVWAFLQAIAGQDRVLISQGSYRYNMRVMLDTEKMRAWIYYNVGWNAFSSDAVFPLNTWTHVVLRINTNKVARMFINGVMQSGTVTAFPEGPFGNLNIGRYPSWPTSSMWNGFIDEVRIYNRALSAEEIKEHYLGGIRRMEIQPEEIE